MKRKVRPFYIPPSLVTRQVASILAFRLATRWKGLPFWTNNLPKLFRVAAGAVGIGCFGFPIHPVYEVTPRCNLRCKHCHVRADENVYGELNTADAKRVIKSLAEVPEFRMLVFTGGEPLVRGDIYDLLLYAKGLGFSTVIATNGTLIDKEAARSLKESGTMGIAASVDCVDPQKHDSFRGLGGAFEKTIHGIENARQEGLYIQINITISRYNLHDLEEMLLLADRLEAQVVLLYQLVPVGRGEEIENAALKPEEFAQVIEQTHRVQEKIRPVVVPVALPEYFAYLSKNELSPRIASLFFKGCIAGRGMYYVKSNGDVWPCAFVPIKAGNLLESSALDIWRNGQVFVRLRGRRNLKKPCGDCLHREVCGGCRGRAYAYANDLFASDPGCPFVEQKSRGRA
ncbi:MAG TPA: radical SAM protein [Chloroflexi bacterium]|nr:radical SAM protein [Chloroflexota bacterium]